MYFSSPKTVESRNHSSQSGNLYSPQSFPELYKQDVFFNSRVPISDLKKITEEVDIEEMFETWDKTHKQFKAWASNVTSPIFPTFQIKKFTKFPYLLTPPPGFERVKPIIKLSEISTESEISPSLDLRQKCTVETNEVKLHPAPLKSGLTKREKRGKFNEESFSDERFIGEIKFYQLKKRFGFISLDIDKTDVFLCEDDLVLSGVNIKKFKETVFKRVPIKLSFAIKFYYEFDQKKRKAVNVKIETEIN